jgi:hypothetical protein
MIPNEKIVEDNVEEAEAKHNCPKSDI